MVAGFAVGVLAACARAPVPAGGPSPAPAPPPVPTQRQGGTVPGAREPLQRAPGGPWTFAYAPGRYTYTLAESARLALLPDTGAWRDMPPLIGRVMLAIGVDGTVQVIDPVAPGIGTQCDSTTGAATAAALALRAATILPTLPRSLVAGATWTDSNRTTGCRGPVLATATTRSTYRVLGDTTYAGTHTVLISRADSVTARGEGAVAQHRVLLAASGTGQGELFVDPVRGVVLGSDGTQVLFLDITTSGRTSRFAQRTEQRATLVEVSSDIP